MGAVQFVQTEMWNGAGYGKTARDCRTHHCHVNFGTEPPQSSCCPFVSFLLAYRSDRISGLPKSKNAACSVDISYGVILMSIETEKMIAEHLFSKRENDFEHTSFDREIAFYESICSGNMELVKVFMQPLFCEGCGVLSEDFLRNLKYHFVVLAAIIARYCINRGMTPEEAYNLSDFYIMKADQCQNESEVRKIHVEMIECYTKRMRKIKLDGVYSKQVVRAIEYMIRHLHKHISLEETADHLRISAAHLSRLFKRETGITFSDYVNKLKIEESTSLLLYTEYSDTEISNLLGFSSQSYFIKMFKKHTGTTPHKYKKQYKVFIMQAAE